MYKERWKNYYFPSKRWVADDKYTLWRRSAAEFSTDAQLRLEWMIFYETAGRRNATLTAKHFGISRKTFHKWHERFNESKGQPAVLKNQSKAPKRVRSWEVSPEEEIRVISLRKKHLKYGKKKLRVIYIREYGEEISTWKIERVIRKHCLFPDKVEYQKERKREVRRAKRPRRRITEIDTGNISDFGRLWHADSITIWWYGQRRVIFTAIEEMTKIGCARVYQTNSSRFAKDFLHRLMFLVEGKIQIIHSDNGSEFEEHFRDSCGELGIEQVFSRPRTPKDNPALERFNWTVQDEWLSMSEVGLYETDEANQDLSEWLIEYNDHRPHENLDYQTPLEYAQHCYFQKVSPMWSASTRSCI